MKPTSQWARRATDKVEMSLVQKDVYSLHTVYQELMIDFEL